MDETGADVEPVHESPNADDARHTHPDVSKVGEMIDYKPSVPIRHVLSKYIE